MDTAQQPGANLDCPDLGQLAHGDIKVYSSQQRRYYCTTRGRGSRAPQGTAFYKLRTPRPDFIGAVGLSAGRGSSRGIARAKAVQPEAVLGW